jgi:hypothetical protein
VMKKSAPPGRETVKQRQHREWFRLATLYAKRCLLQPEMKAEYEAIARAKENPSPFAAAIWDYLNSISITDVITRTYQREGGFPLSILVNDIVKVKTMKVTIIDRGGKILETGDAWHSEGSTGYTYVTKGTAPIGAGIVIQVEVTDRPGNIVMEEVML